MRVFSNMITGNYVSAIELSVFYAGTKITRASAEERGVPRVNARETPVFLQAAASLPLQIVCRREANADEKRGVGKLGTKLFRLRESLLKHAICETRTYKMEKYE